MKRIIILLSAACVLSLSASAQNIYTLEQCKELALKNNARSQNGQYSLEVAQQDKNKAFTNYFPSVSAVGFGFQSTKPMLEMATEQGTVGMVEKGMVGAVTAMQPIFSGGQIITGNKLAKVGVQVAELQKTMADDEVLLAVEQYYWQIVSLEEKVKTIAESETLLNRVHQDVQNMFDAGLVNKNDLLKVELKQNELESGKLKIDNGLKLSKMVLAQFIGVPTEEFDIDKNAAENASVPFVPRIDHQSALSQRAEYQLLDKNIEANKLQVRMEVGKNLPTVAVGAAWNYMSIDKGSPMGMKNNFGMGLVGVSIPISGWWGGSHAIKKQKLQVRIAENEKRNTEELLLIQMQQLWNDLEEAQFQVSLADKAIASALENVRLNEDYYKAGTATLSDLLDAQSALQQTRDQRIEAATNYRIKLSKYKQATGQK